MQQELSLSEYWHIVLKRKWVVIFTLFFFTGFSALLTFFIQTPVYKASALVRIDQYKSVMNVISDLLRWSPGEIMSTEVETAQSPIVLEKVAEATGLIKPGDGADRRAAVVAMLKSNVKAERVESTNMIRIEALSSDPKMAARIANLTTKYYKQVSQLNKTEDVHAAREFVEAQLNKAKDRLRKSEEALRNYKQYSGTLSVDSETQITLDRLNNLENDLLNTRSEREKLRWQMEDLRKRLAKLDIDREVNVLQSSTLDKKYEKLIALRQRIEEAKKIYTDANPDMKDLRGEEKRTFEGLKNGVESQIKAQIQTLQVQDSEQANREAQLTEFVGREVARIPDKDMELSRLTREVKVNEELYTLLNREFKEAQIKEMGMVSEVTIISPAVAPKNPIKPNKKMNLLMGFVLGLVLGFVLTALVESFDTSIGAVEDIERLLETPVLAAVPRFDYALKQSRFPFSKKYKYPISEPIDHTKALPTIFNPGAAEAEAYRHLRTNFSFARLKDNKKVYLISSSGPQEGKSVTTSNLAVVLAQSGLRTLIMCCNLRRPSIHKVFGISRKPGLADVLIGSCTPEEAVHTFADIVLGDLNWEAALQLPGIDNLSILPAGTLPPNPTELLESQKMTDLINYFRRDYDIILLDAPPILPVTDSLLIGAKADGIMLVYQVGRLPRRALIRTRNLAKSLNISVVGIVLNDVRPEFHGVAPIYISHEYMSATKKVLESHNKPLENENGAQRS